MTKQSKDTTALYNETKCLKKDGKAYTSCCVMQTQSVLQHQKAPNLQSRILNCSSKSGSSSAELWTTKHDFYGIKVRLCVFGATRSLPFQSLGAVSFCGTGPIQDGWSSVSSAEGHNPDQKYLHPTLLSDHLCQIITDPSAVWSLSFALSLLHLRSAPLPLGFCGLSCSTHVINIQTLAKILSSLSPEVLFLYFQN